MDPLRCVLNRYSCEDEKEKHTLIYERRGEMWMLFDLTLRKNTACFALLHGEPLSHTAPLGRRLAKLVHQCQIHSLALASLRIVIFGHFRTIYTDGDNCVRSRCV
jgi:hypothetical protein